MASMSPQTTTAEFNEPVHILLVEDDDVDVEVVTRLLKKEHITSPLYTARDGVEALNMLKGRHNSEKMRQPCLILLDINMPLMNGFQLLAEIRRDDTMKKNIVFILTTSNHEDDRKCAAVLHADGYLLKENLGTLAEVLKRYCPTAETP